MELGAGTGAGDGGAEDIIFGNKGSNTKPRDAADNTRVQEMDISESSFSIKVV